MQIFAGSLNVKVDGFLHAGYVSVFPWRQKAWNYSVGVKRAFDKLPEKKLEKTIDVKKALELKDQGRTINLSPSATSFHNTSTGKPFPTASILSSGFNLVAAFFFFAFLFSFYYRRIRKMERRKWAPALFTLGPVLFLLVGSCVPEKFLISHAPPWKDFPTQEYQDPSGATQAILHSLVVPALAANHTGIKNLGAIRDEVGFPVPAEDYSPGMTYAQKTYGRDGWGREYQFEPFGNKLFRITSAGPDGVFGTADDITLVTPSKDSNWEQRINGFFATRVEGKPVCLIHRLDSHPLARENAEKAKEVTGSDLFDLLPFDKVFPQTKKDPDPRFQFGIAEVLHSQPTEKDLDPPILLELKKHTELWESKGKDRPLLFVQFTGEAHE